MCKKEGFFSNLLNSFSKKEELKPFENEEEQALSDFAEEQKEDEFGDFFQPPAPVATSWATTGAQKRKEHS